MTETIGQRRDRMRELKALDRIAASLRLSHLQAALTAAEGETQTYYDTLRTEIRNAEAVLGIPRGGAD
jgi:hypothetical protein